MRVKEKKSGSCIAERKGTEDAKVGRTRLVCVACAAAWAHVMSAPVLTPACFWVLGPTSQVVCDDIHGILLPKNMQRPGVCALT